MIFSKYNLILIKRRTKNRPTDCINVKQKTNILCANGKLHSESPSASVMLCRVIEPSEQFYEPYPLRAPFFTLLLEGADR